ncbi:MAG TPA: PAS domain S-box protein [Candidatus Atribacteria bacterium]|nr:PAS domain S-box protein [Candidatus Atribacteria bacterium]
MKKDKNNKLSNPLREKNIVFALIIILLLTLLLGFMTYKEVQRERYYLWELARSEGLNIAFSIQTLSPRFILNENALKEILVLLKKEGVSYIDICNDKGVILISTEEERWQNIIKISNPSKINFINTKDKKGNRILQVIKPFNLNNNSQLDIWEILPIRNSYLVVGVNLEGYYNRLSQTRKRIILNYSIIMALVLFGIYVIFKLQGNYIVKRTLNEMKVYTSKLLETMDNAVISVDIKGNIKTFNVKSEEIFDKKREEVLNKDCQKVLNLNILGESIFKKCLLEKKNISQEMILEEKGIKKKTLDLNASFLTDESGEITGVVAVIRDITEIKDLNEEVARHKRLAALGKLSAGIAHEIRNPLSSIRGLAQFVYNSFSQADERKEDLNTIIQEVDRLNTLVVQVLDFAKLKKPNLIPFSLNDLIGKMTELFQLEIKDKQIKFNLELSPDISQIHADEDQVRQIFMNIIINAIQAIQVKGEIKIKTEKTLLRGEPVIRLTIEDSGDGIPEKDLSQIFDPFFSTKEKGSGLGLSIVYKLIEAHQGEIKVESKEGEGTKFIIFLPQKGGK